MKDTHTPPRQHPTEAFQESGPLQRWHLTQQPAADFSSHPCAKKQPQMRQTDPRRHKLAIAASSFKSSNPRGSIPQNKTGGVQTHKVASSCKRSTPPREHPSQNLERHAPPMQRLAFKPIINCTPSFRNAELGGQARQAAGLI